MSDNAIFVAASGALVQEMRLEVLSNNLANVNTIGFKADRAVFGNYFDKTQNISTPAEPNNIPDNESLSIRDKNYSNVQVRFDGTKTDFSPGQIKQSGNSFDFALEGDGFFCIETNKGIQQYTRKGNFKIDENNKLITQDGATVLGNGGREIEINTKDSGDISVDEEGNILIDGVKGDSLKIVNFEKPYALIKVGDSSFIKADPTIAEKPIDGAILRQGYIELSNVDPIKIMTEMIEVHRAFESYQKVIQSMDNILSKSIDEVGRAI